MKTASPPSRGRPPGSDAAATRERILAAVEACLIAEHTGGDRGVSNRAIAKAAGITEMTLYRHFPTRADLLRAFWAWLTAKLGTPGMPQTEEQLVAWIHPLFAGFSRHAAAARASMLSSEGIRMRQAVNPERRQAFMAALADAGRGLPADEIRDAAAVVQLLHSGMAWMSMADFWDLDADAAARAATRGITAIIDDLRRRPRTGSPQR